MATFNLTGTDSSSSIEVRDAFKAGLVKVVTQVGVSSETSTFSKGRSGSDFSTGHELDCLSGIFNRSGSDTSQSVESQTSVINTPYVSPPTTLGSLSGFTSNSSYGLTVSERNLGLEESSLWVNGVEILPLGCYA